MTTVAKHRGSRRTAVVLVAFCMFLAASPSLSAMTKYEVAADGEFTFESPNDRVNQATYELVVNAGSTTTVNYPPSGTFYCPVYLKGSGTVVFKKPAYTEYNGGDQVTFSYGIAADSTVTVLVKEVTTVNVGRAVVANDVHYPAVDVANMSFEQAGGKLVLNDKCTARTLPSSFEVAPGANVALQGTNPLGLGSSFALADYDVVVLTRASIPNGCTVTVPPGRTLGLKPAVTVKRDSGDAASTYNWNWSGWNSYFDEAFNIVLGGKGAKVRCRSTSTTLRLFTRVTGTGDIVFMPDSDAAKSELVFRGIKYSAKKSTPVVIPVNAAAEQPVLSDAWKSKVMHWFDASDAATVIKYTKTSSSLRNNFRGQYPVVVGWLDHVKGHSDKFLYSRDAINNHTPYWLPYLVEGGLNGKDYLSFGEYYPNVDMSQVDAQDCPSNKSIARWIQFVSASTSDVVGNAKPSGGYTTVANCKYCIMVLGSQFGGGKSILGDQSGTGLGNIARVSSSVSQPWLAYDGYSMMVDGGKVDAKTTKPTGGWQIISLDMSATNTVLDCLGGHNLTRSTDSTLLNNRRLDLTGGQNYAEVLLFSEVPTDSERMACEAYLAEKWGLESTHSARALQEMFSEVSGGDGDTMTIGDYESTENNVTATNPVPEEVTIAGNYRGTINVAAGKTLVVADRPAPPSIYDIPKQGSIVAWFDPSLDGAVDYLPKLPTGVARLYSRTASGVDNSDGAYWMGMQAAFGINATIGRFPFAVETAYSGASGLAPAMNWMDFTVNDSSETSRTGNTLRSHVLPTTDSDLTATSTSNMTFRSLFMAIDTSAGGGNPVFDEVGMNGAIKARAGYGEDYTKPIWNANNTVTMSHTWLDTTEVDGTTVGYNGRGEVLGFETSEDFTTHRGLFFGYYNPNHSNINYEHIGETIIFSTALSDAERLTVQKYLMAKWLGDMNGGEFGDLSGATVTGEGNVRSASLRNLPAFDAGFAGTLSGGSNMTFTVDSSWNASAAVDAIAIDRAVALDSACAVTVTLKGKAKGGSYTLLTVPSGALAGKTFALDVVNETGKEASAKLVASDTALSLEIIPSGLVISIQ